MSKFQIILTGVFGFFIIVGVLVFASARGSSQVSADVVVWGTISGSTPC